MIVQYMFQTEGENDPEETFESSVIEIRAKAQDFVECRGYENTGHGTGLGDWAYLGESWDWTVTFDMSERDYLALKGEYGLYVEGED